MDRKAIYFMREWKCPHVGGRSAVHSFPSNGLMNSWALFTATLRTVTDNLGGNATHSNRTKVIGLSEKSYSQRDQHQ